MARTVRGAFVGPGLALAMVVMVMADGRMPGPAQASPIDAVCAPRPAIQLQLTKAVTPGVLNVTVTSQAPPIHRLDFKTARGQVAVRSGGTLLRGPGSYTVPDNSATVSFVLTQSPVFGVMHQALSVVDACGAIPKFVGYGQSHVTREQGYAVGFFRDGQSPLTNTCPTVAQIQDDLDRIAVGGLANAVRLYGQSCNLDRVPELAGQRGLGVYAGAFCGSDRAANDREIQQLIDVARANPNVLAVIVCNETRLTGTLPRAELLALIARVRSELGGAVPVTTAEPWGIWLDDASLRDAVDVLVAHVHPYSDGVPAGSAATYVAGRVQQLRQASGKPVVVGETGWPTAGPTRDGAIPGVDAQRQFVDAFLPIAEQAQIPFFFFQAWDEQWKESVEPGVGPNWGTHTADRQPKHPSVRMLRP